MHAAVEAPVLSVGGTEKASYGKKRCEKRGHDEVPFEARGAPV